MDYVIFDLEWNGAYCGELDCYINEIIEFGALKLNENLQIIDEFQTLVRPTIGRRLTSPVRTLTSLTYEDLKRGLPFPYSMKKFSTFCKGSVLMSWSTSDITALAENIRYYNGKTSFGFMTKYCDLQQYCHDMLGLTDSNALGLRTAAGLLGIDADDIPKHRAVGDSYVSAMCLRRLYHPGALNYYIVDADKDFYDSLMYHAYLIDEPELTPSEQSVVTFNCPHCGARAKRSSAFTHKTRAYIARYSCPLCGHDFGGRVQLKKRYDSIQISKKIMK